MNTYLWTMLVLHSLVVVTKAAHLAFSKYPRAYSYTTTEDVGGLLLGGGFLVWVAVVLAS